MKSSDRMLEDLHTPLLATASSGGILVLLCHFGPLWLAAVAAALFMFFAWSLYRRAHYLLEHGVDGRDP